MESKEPETVVLVHGTFATGAPWTVPGSNFWQRLKQGRPQREIISFAWSGANSHMARQVAGSQLADFLIKRGKSCPSERYHLICHSHGGNVALYAARFPAVRSILASIVFLGTPFVQGSARKVAIGISPIITALVSALFLYPIYLLTGGDTRPLLAITVPLALFLWFGLRIHIRDRITSLLVAKAEAFQEKKASDLFVNVAGMRCLRAGLGNLNGAISGVSA